MAGLLFGTAGIPRSTKMPSTVSGIERIKELGLDGMELEFVRGVKMSDTSAYAVRETATRLGVKLSAHAPYFINLNAHEVEKIRASQQRIRQTARVAAWCGAGSVVFHPAFYLGDPPEKAYNTVRNYLGEVQDQLKEVTSEVRLRPESAGKISQFGGLAEILNLCRDLTGLLPCIDFAHHHARTGKFNSYPEFTSILEQVKERLGTGALSDMHIHVAGIAYGQKGEIRHLNLEESDFRYTDLLRALKDYDVQGMVISESPNLEGDAQLLQAAYHAL